MPGRRYEEFEYEGYTFRFLYDREFADRLHVEASHGLSAEEAIDVFFDGAHTTRERTDLRLSDGTRTYETLHKNRGIWWKWIDQSKNHVLIWSFFTRYR